MSKQKFLKVTLLRSLNAALPNHKATAKGLGLRRIRHTVTVLDNACTRGMVQNIIHLLSVEEV
jgi:large subunit ribosomal protein L30